MKPENETKPSKGIVAVALTVFPWLSAHYQAELRRQNSYGDGEARLAEIIKSEISAAELKPLKELLYQVRDITGHTPDCPEGLTQARISRRISTAIELCSETCKAIDEALRTPPR